MRLLVIMATRSPWSQSVAASLAALGHEVHVADVEKGPTGGIGDPSIPGLRDDYERFKGSVAGVYDLASPVGGSMRYFWAAPRLRRLFHRIHADLLLTLYGGGFGLMAYLSGIRPYCLYVVGSDVLRASAAVRRFNRLAFRSAACVFANGEFLANQARAQAPEARVTTLLIGVETARLTPADFSRRPVQIICTRGFRPIYNSAAVVRSLAKLAAGLPDYRVVFTSVRDLGLEEVNALADRYLLPDVRARVEFGGGGSYSSILESLSRSHIYVSMSRSDGTATSLLEALGSGLFPVLSDIPQNREWIDHRVGNGRLVPLDDDDVLAEALGDCIAGVDRLAVHAEENRRLVYDRADAERTRLTLSERLEEALAAHHEGNG